MNALAGARPLWGIIVDEGKIASEALMFETVEKIYTKEVNRHAKLFRCDLLIISMESNKPILSIPKNGTAFGLKFAQLGNRVLASSRVCVLVAENSGVSPLGKGSWSAW